MKMKKLTTLAAYALIAPALTLGFGSAFATDPPAGLPDSKEQRSTYEQRTTKEEYSQEQRQSQQDQRQTPQQSQMDKGLSTADRAKDQRTAAERAQKMKAPGTFLSSAPANSFRADELIGANLKSRSDNETIGSITDLVIDEDGQIVAVIVEAGGFLGLGQKDVAVSWDSIEHRSNDDNDGYDFTVNTTKESLTNAAEFKTRTSGARQY